MLWNTGQMTGTVLLDGNYTNMAYDNVIRYAQNPNHYECFSRPLPRPPKQLDYPTAPPRLTQAAQVPLNGPQNLAYLAAGDGLAMWSTLSS